jgi:roadblock/LC7 domain-containing protein
MFQKVEALTGLRMEKYEVEADAALLLLERTTEAQQMATMQARAWSLLSQACVVATTATNCGKPLWASCLLGCSVGITVGEGW